MPKNPPKDVYPQPTADELSVLETHIKRLVVARNDELEESGEKHRINAKAFEATVRNKILAKTATGRVTRENILGRA